MLNSKHSRTTLLIFLILMPITTVVLPNIVKQAYAATTVYDFIAHASDASTLWSSGAGSLKFPGSDTDSKGFARYADKATLEDGTTWPRVLETHPQWVSDGYIIGRYPQITVAVNVQLRVNVGFLKGATATDGVTFEVYFEYMQKRTLILSQYSTYDAKLDSLVKSLSSFAGNTGDFILYVKAGKSSSQDWAVWAEARIETIPLPDLTITDIWSVGSVINYKVKNVGDARIGSLAAPSTFSNVLFIDGKQVAKDTITGILEPGQELERSFNYQWQMTPPQDTVRVQADYEQNVVEKDEQNNFREEVWVVEALPDLTPLEMSLTPTKPRIGEKVTITVSIKNIGGTVSAACQCALIVAKDVVSTINIPSLKPSETTNVILNWIPNVKGILLLSFFTDYGNTVKESNENNNELQRTIEVPGKPDLVALGISWSPEVLTINRIAIFQPLVQNIGESDSAPCTADFIVDGNKIGSVDIPSIPAGKRLNEIGTQVYLSWTPRTSGPHKIGLVVDTNNANDELNETNNIAETTIDVKAADTTPPTVSIIYVPPRLDDPRPTEKDTVLFIARASDESGIASITIYVNGMAVKTVNDATSCNYTGGPYPRGSTVRYAAQATDKAGLPTLTPTYNFTVRPYYTGTLTVEMRINPPEPTEIDEITFTATASYPYGVKTLRIYLNGHKVKEVSDTTTVGIVRGPWASGSTVTYFAEAYSVDDTYARTPERSFTVRTLSRENTKNMSNYLDREVFVISDLDWRAVLSLVPIAVWRETSPTEPVAPGSIYSFPVLIYHQENRTWFDADSTIRFLQQYAEYGRNRYGLRVTILGEPPTELLELMIAPTPLGAGLQESQIRVWRAPTPTTTLTTISLTISPIETSTYTTALRDKWGISVTIPSGGTSGIVPMDDIFTKQEERQLRAQYWSNLNVYVLSQDEYATGLMASVFASYIDAPVIFQGQYDLSELDHKSVYLVGSFTDDEVNRLRAGNVNILYRFTLDQLRRHYVIATGTDKVILVNPTDLWINRKYIYYTTDKGQPISWLYGKTSLAAPFLAAAKKEVIISIDSQSYPEIDTYVKQQMESLPLGGILKYLTIVASPEAIPIARPNVAYPVALCGDSLFYQVQRFIDIDIVRKDLRTGAEEYQTTNGRMQFAPACSQDIVAWVDEETWGDIYYRDLRTGTTIRLTGSGEDLAGQHRPAVYGRKIVWQDYRNGNWDIYMHDAATGTTRRVTSEAANQESPGIWDRYIIWQQDVGNWEIYAYDTQTGSTFAVTTDPESQERPSIWSNKIVYCDNRNGQWDVYMSWLDGARAAGERRITTNLGMQWRPRIHSDKIVWQDNRNGNWDIYMHDLNTGTEQRITYEAIDQVLPTIWEDKIAWLERSEEGWWYICIHNISTGSRSRVAQTEVSADDGALWLEVDGRYYGSTQNMGHQDIATGRIYGVTVSDASAYIARDLFFDRINKNRDALVVVREDWQDEIGNGGRDGDVLEGYARSHYWTAEIEDHFTNVRFYSGHDEVTANSGTIYTLYDDYGLIVFVDHGWQGGFADAMDSYYLCNNKIQLKPATIIDLACLTGAYYVEVTTGGNPPFLFSAQNIRRGAMVYMGATDVSYWHTMFDDILYGIYEERKTIGQAYLEARNEDYDEEHWNFSLTLKGDIFYALHGDPTFQPKWLEWQQMEEWWP